MRSAVRTVKEKGKDVKSAYKGIRTRMRKDGHGGVVHTDRTEPSNSNSTFHRARPLTVGSPVVASSTFKKQRSTSTVATSRSANRNKSMFFQALRFVVVVIKENENGGRQHEN